MDYSVAFPGLGLDFSLNQPFFSIFGFKIYYYGIIITLGLILGLIYAFKNFRKVGVDPDKAIDCVLGGIVGGIIGARLYYVIFTWDEFGLDFQSAQAFWASFLRLFNTREGGMAIYGGIIGALLVGVLIAKWRKINVKALLDVIGVGFLIGQGVGRWGNFVNIEAFGSNTTLPWGMTSTVITNYLASKQEYFASVGITVDPNLPVHPCFLYESLWCLLGFVLLAFYMKHRKFDGEVFLLYLAYYGAGRMIIEGFRTDSLMIGALRVSQILAALLVVASVIAILVTRSRIKSSHDPSFMPVFSTTEEGLLIVNNVKPTDELDSDIQLSNDNLDEDDTVTTANAEDENMLPQETPEEVDENGKAD